MELRDLVKRLEEIETEARDKKEYGLEDGNVIAFNTNATPTRGRELTILQQLFGNLGRLGAGNLPGN